MGKGKKGGKGKPKQNAESSTTVGSITSPTGGTSVGAEANGPSDTNQAFGRMPQKMSCPQCRKNIVTTLTPVNGAAVWIGCISFCLCIMWPCALCVLCCDEFKDWQHNCPVCGHDFGTYQRLKC